MNPSRSCILVTLIGALGLADSQIVANSENDPRYLRRRLQEKTYPSLWAQDSQNDHLKSDVSAPISQSTNPANVLKRFVPSLWASDPKTVVQQPESDASPQTVLADSHVDAQPKSTTSNVLNRILPTLWASDPKTVVQQPKSDASPQTLVLADSHAGAQPKSTTSQAAVIHIDPVGQPNRRKFVSYQPSEWERFWLENIEVLQDDRKICKVLLEDQIENLRDFLTLLCTARLMAPYQNWCVIDDGHTPLWFNTANTNTLDLTFERPVPLIIGIPPPETVTPSGPQHAHILSKLTFYDEANGETYDEYIEPLVGHLRFPLQKCLHPSPVTPQYRNNYMSFRGWILPPPPIVRGDNVLYVDAASASWESKRGGVSPQFVVDTWFRHGLEIDSISVFSKETTSTEFYEDVPADMVAKTTFKQCSLSGNLQGDSEDTPFLPRFINNLATVNDYVILKLDIGNMVGRYNHLAYLDSAENRVDELVWEHKSESMFLADRLIETDMTLRQSYEIFFMLRQRGIRAHAWM